MTRKLPDSVVSKPTLQRVFSLFVDAGHSVYLVGGTVRNALLGQPVTDFDLATDALPERVIELSDAAGVRYVPTGILHGTITLIVDGHPFEVTTFRKDIETDGRHATVSFSKSILDDALRRDFTMNALYAAPDGCVEDPLGGLPDLESRRVRFVGLPEDRIREDYLRILRFFRFTAWYADPEQGIDPEGLAACAELSEGLTRLSAERVWAELKKLLCAPDPAWVFATMAQAGVLARCLPGTVANHIAPLVHAENQLRLAPDPVRRLVALGGSNPEKALRLSRAELRQSGSLRSHVSSSERPLELGYRLGEATALDVIALRFSLMEALFSEGTLADLKRGASAVFPVRAADLPTGLEGPQIGQTLEALETYWLANDCAPSKEDLLRRV